MDTVEEKTMRIQTIALAIALAMGTSAAMSATPGNSLRQNNTDMRHRADENSLRREVNHELTLVPRYSVFDILQYRVNGNDVTLTGAVVNPTLKSDAENAVKHIEGVEKIDNRIEVLPPSPMDDQLRWAEYRAIYSQPSLSRYGIGMLQSIHIIVKGGHVTLEGNVDSEADKDAANIFANGVPNVFSVTNDLIVTGKK
jgi:osmotically-inducible protein OsmY